MRIVAKWKSQDSQCIGTAVGASNVVVTHPASPTIPRPTLAILRHVITVTGLVCVQMLACTTAGADNSISGPFDAPASTSSRQLFFYENAHLHLASENGNSIAERGYAHGTYNAPVVCTFHISPRQVIKAFYTIYPPGGSVSGEATARYVIKGETGYYGGHMTIKKGTGRFSSASGRNIGFSGTINRSNFDVVTKVHGWITQ